MKDGSQALKDSPNTRARRAVSQPLLYSHMAAAGGSKKPEATPGPVDPKEIKNFIDVQLRIANLELTQVRLLTQLAAVSSELMTAKREADFFRRARAYVSQFEAEREATAKGGYSPMQLSAPHTPLCQPSPVSGAMIPPSPSGSAQLRPGTLPPSFTL